MTASDRGEVARPDQLDSMPSCGVFRDDELVRQTARYALYLEKRLADRDPFMDDYSLRLNAKGDELASLRLKARVLTELTTQEKE